MIAFNLFDWRDVLFHFRLFINGTLTGALLAVIIYRNVTLKYSTKRRLW